MGVDLGNYKELYIKTAHEYIDAMHAGLMIVASESNNSDAIETVYRSAHSLKSQSLLMGYKNTASLNEFIEHVFRNIKDGKVTITEKILLEVKTALEKIEDSVQSIDDLNKEVPFAAAIVN